MLESNMVTFHLLLFYDLIDVVSRGNGRGDRVRVQHLDIGVPSTGQVKGS